MTPVSDRRIAAGLSVVGFVLVAIVLLWSDRGAQALGPVKNMVIRVGRSVEQMYGSNIADRDDIPGRSDQIGHAALWGSGMLIIGWALHRRVPVLLTAFFVAGLSLAFEIAQPIVSTSRLFEPGDAIANTVGIVLVAIPLSMAVWAWRQLVVVDHEYFDERAHW